MAESRRRLQEIPGYSQGVRRNSAVRTIKLGRPICPFSRVEYERTPMGQMVPKERKGNEQNCQLAGGAWWIDCKDRGHDPYFTNRKWTTEEPVIETDDQGRLIQTGTQHILHEDRQPNVAQVAVSIRINQGQGARLAIEQKGFVRLPELGYKEVCQFRNCQKALLVTAKSRKYGEYCSQEHLHLVTADAESILLPRPGPGMTGEEQQRSRRKYDREMREVAVMASE